jgi:choline-glycine betaine transporter
MFITLLVMFFVFAILAWAVYALVRPFTHTHYRHPSGRLWRPLD